METNKNESRRLQKIIWSHATHLLFLSNLPKRGVAGSAIKITRTSPKAAKRPLSSHVGGDPGVQAFWRIESHKPACGLGCGVPEDELVGSKFFETNEWAAGEIQLRKSLV